MLVFSHEILIFFFPVFNLNLSQRQSSSLQLCHHFEPCTSGFGPNLLSLLLYFFGDGSRRIKLWRTSALRGSAQVSEVSDNITSKTCSFSKLHALFADNLLAFKF